MRSVFVVPAMLLAVGSVAHGQVTAFASVDSAVGGEFDSTVTVPAGAHLFAQLQRPLDTRTAKAGDSVYMQITFPVTVDDKVLIPAGTYALATLDSVARRGWIHHTIELQLRLTSLLFANGYVATVRQPAQAQPRDPAALGPAEQPKTLLAVGGAAPLAGLAIGAAAGGQRNVFVGGAIGGAVGLATAIVALTRNSDYSLAPGFPLELHSQGPFELDAKRAADAAKLASPVQSHQNSGEQCYTPGTPGTPDIYVPGTPGTPPVGDFPGTPGTPDIVIPGTPDIPGYWHPCP
jgi:hypothetical protein